MFHRTLAPLATILSVCTVLVVSASRVSARPDAGAPAPRFEAARGYPVPLIPTFVGVADVTGEGLPDIVTASQGDVVSLLRNLGGRSFARENFPTGTSGNFLTGAVVADLNGDLFPDVATESENPGNGLGTVSVLINDAGNGFLAPATYPLAQESISIAAGDVNGDGHPDLAVMVSDVHSAKEAAAVMLNAGDGTFGSPTLFPAPHVFGPSALVDLNGDGSIDVVALDRGTSVVGVLLGDGAGSFGTESTYPAGILPESLAVGDLNHDDRPDAAVGGFAGSGEVLLNQGDGTFGPPVSVNLSAGGGIAYVAIGDIQGDGNPDIATASSNGWVSPSFGRGDGTVRAGGRFAAGAGPEGIAIADLDLDGRQDVVAIDNPGIAATLYGARGSFYAGQLVQLAKGSIGANAFDAADLNGDGLADVVIGAGTGGSRPSSPSSVPLPNLMISINDGTGRYGHPTVYSVPWDPTSIATADFNGDGIVDVVAALGLNDTDNLAVLVGTGGGSFQQPSILSFPNFGEAVVTGDFTDDGKQDIALAIFNSFVQTAQVEVLPGLGDGTFASAIVTDIGPGEPLSMVATDIDGGPTLDLALLVQSIQSSKAFVVPALGTGTGTFSASGQYSVGQGRGQLTSADLDQNGTADVVATAPENDGVFPLLGAGDGTFSPAPGMIVGRSPHWLSLADFNDDGTPDLVVIDDSGNLWSFGGNGDGTFGTPIEYAAPVGPLATGDVQGDGVPDVLQGEEGAYIVGLCLGLRP